MAPSDVRRRAPPEMQPHIIEFRLLCGLPNRPAPVMEH